MIFPSLACIALALGVSGAAIDAQTAKKRDVVPGVVFDRYITIWLENTNFASAASDPNFAALVKQGLQLTNFFAVTHPSQPNYIASVSGDHFGMNSDSFFRIPANVSTVVDLLEEQGISWGEYQEDMPETGFQGMQQLSATGANDYVRKHNPLITYDAVANFTSRTNNIKNFTLFQQDLENDALPQWMFITPNMTNDGHDTNITFSGKWAFDFLTPLLSDDRFNGERTLILLTFDENGSSDPHNRIDTVALGTAVPQELIGTQDPTFYSHYSTIATVSANWGLNTLGRHDVGANVFSFVASHTGDEIRSLDLTQTWLNGSYPGPYNNNPSGVIPVPNTRLVVNGRFVSPKVVDIWGSPVIQHCAAYTGDLVLPSILTPPVIPEGC